MVEHTQIIRRLLPTNCLSVFDYIVGLAFKGLTLKHGSPQSQQLTASINVKAVRWKKLPENS